MKENKSPFQDELTARLNRMNKRTTKDYRKNVQICQKVFETLTYKEVETLAILRGLPQQCQFYIRKNIEKAYIHWLQHVEAVREVDCSDKVDLWVNYPNQ